MAKEDEKKEDEKLIPVGEGIETSDEESKQPADKAEATGSDEKIGQGEDDEDDKDDDGTLETDPERARIRERRRKEKQRRSQRIASDRRELEFLRKRNDDVERQLSHVVLRQDKAEVVSIDQRIGYLEGQIREAESIHTEAVNAKDGATATEALRVTGQLREHLTRLKDDKEEKSKPPAKAAPESRGPDPEAIVNGREWLSDNDWFDPNLKDEDSFLARALEERLAREGRLNPRDPEYWEELNRRIEKRLPGLRKEKKAKDDDDPDGVFTEDDDKPQKKPVRKGGGPRIAVGGKTRSLKPNEVYISEQRKQALIDAGVWDDPEKRDRYMRSYKKYDDEAAQRNS